jgi:hydrogenase maturation protein HypF
MLRLSIQVQGVVQGVGFRPFVYRLAHRFGLRGWVRNRPEGVEIEVQGSAEGLEAFRRALEGERPAPARIRSLETHELSLQAEEETFRILPSTEGLETRPSVPADLALCADCARELGDPRDRRFGYPFINCTHCGPRYSIIAGLPYDRSRTSMAGFPLCPPCQREYEDPLDRRFHAEPVACPVCGPRLALCTPAQELLAQGEESLALAVRALERGEILALKGLGGYQLLVDAQSEPAVGRLRIRKQREEKPFAVMFPDLSCLESCCRVSEAESAWLQAPEAPILLLVRKPGAGLAPSVAPGNPRIGAFLPYTPLHRRVLAALGRPLICTSGNLSEEPMAIDEPDAFERLGGIADLFLVHDRPILRPVDDSVLRLDGQGPTLLRRARGYAPLAHPVPYEGPPVLALGGHQKSTIALLKGGEAILSQHLGDLHSLQGGQLLERTVRDLLAFLETRPGILACDLHPDYASTRLAERLVQAGDLPLVRVQHHHAHVAAVMAEHGLEGPVLGLAWDGSGWGTDGTVWGGEALVVDTRGFRRLGHLRVFPLPGGEKAVQEPLRCAAGLLWEVQGEAGLEALEPLLGGQSRILRAMLARGLQTPRTSSLGRLFDAVSALTGIRIRRGFEGQAAMELEFAAQAADGEGAYPWAFDGTVADPAPLVEALLRDRTRGVSPGIMARRFHQALGDLALEWARRSGCTEIVLSGGCFQNALLVDRVLGRLQAGGFHAYLPRLFPPNDGALSLGQARVAAWRNQGTPSDPLVQNFDLAREGR